MMAVVVAAAEWLTSLDCNDSMSNHCCHSFVGMFVSVILWLMAAFPKNGMVEFEQELSSSICWIVVPVTVDVGLMLSDDDVHLPFTYSKMT